MTNLAHLESSFFFLESVPSTFIDELYTGFGLLPDITYKNKRQATWEPDCASINQACPGWPVCLYLHNLGAVNASPCQSLACASATESGWLSVDAMFWWLHLNTFSRNSFVSLSKEPNMELACRGDYDAKLSDGKWNGEGCCFMEKGTGERLAQSVS